MRRLLLFLLLLGACCQAAQAALRVYTLHPLLTEMAQRIGGEEVEVVSLFPPNGELHDFAPEPAAVAAVSAADMLLACGQGTEPYLDKLREALPPSVHIVELGDTLPRVLLPGTDIADPHWWNSPAAMARASRVLSDLMGELAPAHATAYAARRRAYAVEMAELTDAAQLILARIPAEQRVLVTEHAAFCHFCREFRFTPLPVNGIAQESEGDTASLAGLLTRLRCAHVPALFAELNESPRALTVLAAETNAQVHPLIMDGYAPGYTTYREVFLFNLGHILTAFAPELPPHLNALLP